MTIDELTGRRVANRAAQVAAGFALLCGVGWYTKFAVLSATDGAESGLVGTLWAVGMLSFLAAAAAAAVALLRGKHVALRIIAGVVAVPIAFIVFNILGGITKSIYNGDEWFHDEVELLVTGAVSALLGLGWLMRERQGSAGD